MSPSTKTIAKTLESAPKLVVATIAIMEELARVLMQEIDIVTRRQIAAHAPLVAHKQKLSRDYQDNIKAITAQQDILRTLSDGAKQAWREAAQKLSQAAQDNARALRAAINAAQQLIQNIMAMIKSDILAKPTYANPATKHLQLGVYSPTCRPIAVNRTA